jgi:hypothetical protein
MAEPTSAYSVYDMILHVAKAAKIPYYGSDGQQIEMVPTNLHDFDRCLRVVNDGFRRFVNDAPPEGWEWQKRVASVTFGIVEHTGTVDSGDATSLVDATLEDTYDADDDLNGYYVYDTTQEIQALITDYTASGGDITVGAWLDYYGNASSLTPSAGDSFSVTDVATVAGDKSRYFLPDNFGEVAGEIEYAKDSNVGHIEWETASVIRSARANGASYGNPIVAAIDTSLNRKWELLVYPSPTSAKTVKFPYRVGFDGLRALSGLASSGSGTTLVDSSFANVYPDDYFNGWFITTHDGTGKNGYAVVTDFTGATCTFTVADWLSASDKTTAAATDPTTNTSYFVTDGIKHPAGLRFDKAVRSAIMVETAQEFGKLDFDAIGEYINKDLPEAHSADARTKPRTSGRMRSGSPRMFGHGREHHPRQHRSWTDVTYS